jgi:hypothetical protein
MKRKPVNSLLPLPYGNMTAAELDAEVAKFDREMTGLSGKPLTASQRIQHWRARRMAPPVTGQSGSSMVIDLT